MLRREAARVAEEARKVLAAKIKADREAAAKEAAIKAEEAAKEGEEEGKGGGEAAEGRGGGCRGGGGCSRGGMTRHRSSENAALYYRRASTR